MTVNVDLPVGTRYMATAAVDRFHDNDVKVDENVYTTVN